MSDGKVKYMNMKYEFTETNFAKLNVIQQEIADIFQKNQLTRPEVFVILKGMRRFKMVNKELADEWWNKLIADGDYFKIKDEL